MPVVAIRVSFVRFVAADQVPAASAPERPPAKAMGKNSGKDLLTSAVEPAAVRMVSWSTFWIRLASVCLVCLAYKVNMSTRVSRGVSGSVRPSSRASSMMDFCRAGERVPDLERRLYQASATSSKGRTPFSAKAATSVRRLGFSRKKPPRYCSRASLRCWRSAISACSSMAWALARMAAVMPPMIAVTPKRPVAHDFRPVAHLVKRPSEWAAFSERLSRPAPPVRPAWWI